MVLTVQVVRTVVQNIFTDPMTLIDTRSLGLAVALKSFDTTDSAAPASIADLLARSPEFIRGWIHKVRVGRQVGRLNHAPARTRYSVGSLPADDIVF